MKATQYTLATQKETPADAEVASHRLMLRAGLVRKLASGIYSWLPLGHRTLRKVEAIIREEMDAAGAQELLLPMVQPAELWQESGRWQEYDEGLLLKFADRSGRPFCLGPTHEEVITSIARDHLRSHRQLPVNFYQIQTKFRDETRPRFGILRAREFVMKDAYSFHLDAASLDATYAQMHAAYSRILERMQLDFRAVAADTGAIGGKDSMEFHVLAESGEDRLVFSDAGPYAANMEMAEAPAPPDEAEPMQAVEELATPGIKTIAGLVEGHGIPIGKTIKTLIAKGQDGGLLALALRGDHQLSQVKAEKPEGVAAPLCFASEEEIRAAIGASPGSLGPQGLSMPILVDRAAAAVRNFSAGANKDGWHLLNLNWQRDVPSYRIEDLREVQAGDPSPDGKGRLLVKRGIEVGHIFKLGDKYSKAMKARVLDEAGKAVAMSMGCYGMGVTRLVGAIIEQHHDDRGIVWPAAVAPFQVVVIPVGGHESGDVREAAERLYQSLLDAGVEALLDDREGLRPGAKFADAELMGFPHRLVVGERSLAKGLVEHVERATGRRKEAPVKAALALLTQR